MLFKVAIILNLVENRQRNPVLIGIQARMLAQKTFPEVKITVKWRQLRTRLRPKEKYP